MNRLDEMKAAAENPWHPWWDAGYAPANLRDLIQAVEAARHLKGTPVIHEEATYRLESALERLDAAEVL